MKLMFRRYLLLQKRLIRRKSYIAMVLSVFVFILILRGVATQDSSMTSVAIAVEVGADEAALELYSGLDSPSFLIRYIKYDTVEEAMDAVAKGKADEAWIIPAHLSNFIDDFTAHSFVAEPIKIYVREPNVLHFFLKEMLVAQLYKQVSKQIFEEYSIEKIGTVTVDFASNVPTGDPFKMYDVGDDISEEQPDYVIAPLRGFIALWMLISAIAAAMYYIYDDKKGLFIFWKTKYGFLREFLYIAVVLINSSVIAFIGLCLGGVLTNAFTEIFLLLFYSLILIFFSMVLRKLLRNELVIGIFTPLIVTVAATLSPVFMDLRSFWYIQKLIPTYHYLESIYDPYYRIGMSMYCVCMGVLAVLLYFIRKLRTR